MTVDYKSTLNLPTTGFPMRANLPQNEPQWLAKWEKENQYQQIRDHFNGKKRFILHMGPPYANGDIHIGHALTTILKDIIVKSKGLSGFDAPLVPGWDCHGLPIEINVEKKIGLANVDVPAAAFREACREYAQSQVDLQRASFIRLGIFADWSNPYLTMNKQYEAAVVRSIGDVLDKGHLQQGAKPVHWCVNCGSALAEAEVEYQDKQSPAIDVMFPVVDVPAFLAKIPGASTQGLTRVAWVIWTTTPWTLPANQAVAVHPDLDYVLVKGQFGAMEAICVLADLLDACMARYGSTDHQVIAQFKGNAVAQVLLQHPFYDRQVPIVLGEHVTVDAGTGAVHTAPGHGLEDYQIGQQYHLPIETPVGNNGCFYPDLPLFGGLFVFKANAVIIDTLREKQYLLSENNLLHSYPHCWRHKTPLIFRATPQWFVSMSHKGLRDAVLSSIKTIQWVPGWGENRMQIMIEGRPDWCISRQRTWGVPLTLLTHRTTKALHPRMREIIDWVADQIHESGIEAWHECDVTAFPFEDMDQYEKSQDVLDVWYESGTSHTAVLKARADLQFPADLYLEGSDQFRGWFQSSLLSSMAMTDQPPYKGVLSHGFTVDAQGRKMSKSLGNVISPEKVVKTLGADVLRLWVSSTDYKTEIHVSDEILTRMSDAYRRIRNTTRFLLANLDGFDPATDLVKPAELLTLDAWLVACTAKLQQEILEAYDTYQFHLIYQKIHQFCVVELGSFYLDVIKDRQYTNKKNSLARRSAQTALYHLAHALTRWMAPILSFTAEEIWSYLPGEKTSSVFLAQWYADLPAITEKQMWGFDYWEQVMAVRNQVNRALEQQRNQGIIGAPLDASVTLYAGPALQTALQRLSAELRFVFITSDAFIKPLEEKPHDAMATDRDDLFISVTTSPYEKCVRCWHHRETVNQDTRYPEICDRCVENVDPASQGEERLYV